jgi:ribosomal protein S18 acetylase RimI-like enzyme
MCVARVWLAEDEDVDSVATLMAEFRDHMGRAEPVLEQVRATAGTLLRDPNTEFLLAAPDGADAPAAVCQLRFRLAIWTGADDCWLEDLFVRGEARRSGLGRALVGAALERAEARGCRRIELDVDEDNASARALYSAMGLSDTSKPPGRNLVMGRRLGS